MFAPSSCLVIITTVDAQGRVNAASHGTCTRVAHDPVYLSFTTSIGKDTCNNALATGEFVANVVPFEPDMLDKTLICGLPFKPGIDELEKAGLTAVTSRVVRPPRIGQCHSHFECRVEWTKTWIDRVMVCGKVEAVSVDEGCITGKGEIVWERIKPAHYCGGRYQDRFVPVFDTPTRATWSYDGHDDEFRAGMSWRDAYKSTD